MAYPDWLRDTIRRVPCIECGSVLGVGEIVMVGAAVHPAIGPFPSSVALVIECRCWSCKKTLRITEQHSKEEITEVCDSLLDVAEASGGHGKTAILGHYAEEPTDSPPQPHVRIDSRDLFDTPIHPKQVEQFKRLLARVSPRRNSKTWRAFLSRLRIDPDALAED